MIDHLKSLQARFQEVSEMLTQPKIIADRKQFAALCKEHKYLSQVNDLGNTYINTIAQITCARDMARQEQDQDFQDIAREEIIVLEQRQKEVEKQLHSLLVPRDPNYEKDIILEIRACTGGDEAAIFAGDLFRMYQRFIEKMNWKLSLISHTEGPSGGYKEIICNVTGTDVYGVMKHESGVHRVQRVPATETQGRVHTSAASVVVLPEMDSVEVDIDMNDIRKDTFCSSGPGGQSVNTTYSAVRLTHLPTGIVVSCQDEKSQLKNLDKALKVLRSRLYKLALQEQQDKVDAKRKTMVKSGDRSDKIRTYNYPQSRITDHRVGYTVHNLFSVMDGDLQQLIQAVSEGHV